MKPRTTPLQRRTPFATVIPLQRRTTLHPASAKTRRRNTARAVLVAEELARRTECEAIWDPPGDGCTIRTVHLHEPLTRARGGDILDPANTVAVCAYCHSAIHDNPAVAVARGLMVPSTATAAEIEEARRQRQERRWRLRSV